jgi:hypothetical protein
MEGVVQVVAISHAYDPAKDIYHEMVGYGDLESSCFTVDTFIPCSRILKVKQFPDFKTHRQARNVFSGIRMSNEVLYYVQLENHSWYTSHCKCVMRNYIEYSIGGDDTQEYPPISPPSNDVDCVCKDDGALFPLYEIVVSNDSGELAYNHEKDTWYAPPSLTYLVHPDSRPEMQHFLNRKKARTTE